MNYDLYPDDRIIIEMDIRNGNGKGITAKLLAQMVEKHGWGLKKELEWFSRGKMKAEDIAHFTLVFTKNKHIENN